MVKFLDGCLDSGDWIKYISGYTPVDSLITYEELEKITKENENVKKARYNHEDYSISEIDYIMDNNERFDDVVLVRFKNGYGGYEYRMCEV